MSTPLFRLNPTAVGEVVWRDLLSDLDVERAQLDRRLGDLWAACEGTRAKMEYNTGSISPASGLALYALTRRLAPKQVFEVGTFVGKSTVAMALGADDAGVEGGVLHTCDASNDFHLPWTGRMKVIGYPRKTSTQALDLAAAAGAQIDFFHLDGRLGEVDLPLVQRVAKPTAVFALDDFEGMEKGVANLMMLRSQPWTRGHVLAYPPQRHLLVEAGILSLSTTALLMPAALFGFTNQ